MDKTTWNRTDQVNLVSTSMPTEEKKDTEDTHANVSGEQTWKYICKTNIILNSKKQTWINFLVDVSGSVDDLYCYDIGSALRISPGLVCEPQCG